MTPTRPTIEWLDLMTQMKVTQLSVLQREAAGMRQHRTDATIGKRINQVQKRCALLQAKQK